MFNPLVGTLSAGRDKVVCDLIRDNVQDQLRVKFGDTRDTSGQLEVNMGWLDPLQQETVKWKDQRGEPTEQDKIDLAQIQSRFDLLSSWFASLLVDSRALEQPMQVANNVTVNRIETMVRSLLQERQAEGGALFKEQVLHILGVQRKPQMEMVTRRHQNLWLNGMCVGSLAKMPRSRGYSLHVKGWYWRHDQANQVSGSTAQHVSSVVEGMQIAQELLVPGSGGKMGVVSQM